MNTTLRTDITVADICDGFVYNQLEGKGLYEAVPQDCRHLVSLP